MVLTQKVMPCSGNCREKFSEQDVHDGLYFVTTMTCKRCYVGLQKQPHIISCFGKKNKSRNGKTVGYGYDRSKDTCRTECPDRDICRAFVELT